MRKADIVCRLCAHRYSQDTGCDVCVLAKKNILWPSVDELPYLDSVMAQNIRLLVKVAELQENALDESLGAKSGVIDAKTAAAINQNATALTRTLDAARKLEARNRSKAKNLTNEGKRKLITEWVIHDLPPEEQELLMVDLLQHFKTPAGLPE